MSELKNQLDIHLPEIVAEFNKVLVNKGLDHLSLTNFSVIPKDQDVSPCQKHGTLFDVKTGIIHVICLDKKA